jgi:hypothetical protein
MGFVAVPSRLADLELAFLDFCGINVGLKMCRSRRAVVDGGLRRNRRRGRLLGCVFDLSWASLPRTGFTAVTDPEARLGGVGSVGADVSSGLERNGQPIGANDMLIAAHALVLDLTVVTDNEREFLQVDDLRVENWLR